MTTMQSSGKRATLTIGLRKSRVEISRSQGLKKKICHTTIIIPRMRRRVKSITELEIKAGWKIGSLKTTLATTT